MCTVAIEWSVKGYHHFHISRPEVNAELMVKNEDWNRFDPYAMTTSMRFSWQTRSSWWWCGTLLHIQSGSENRDFQKYY